MDSGADASPGPIDHEKLRRGIEQANVPSLLMVLVQLTGDEAWLNEPFRPRRGRGLDDNDGAGLPDAVQATIRSAACEAIFAWLRGTPAKLAHPDRSFLAKMLGVAMAEPVPEQYGEVLEAAMGLAPPSPRRKAPAGTRAIVVGAGVSGICAAVNLIKMGVECQIFEKNADFGGTWWENRYPGCGVDTPNLTYTFSFAANDWSRYFPLQQEILGYLQETARQYELKKYVRFGSTVRRARWDDREQQWEVTVTDPQGQETVSRADILMSAAGILNTPLIPRIKGLESFPGPAFHSSSWPEGLDVAGKRVAVIGNGASAMQIVPAIAPKVSQLTIFARSKQWAAPFPQMGKQVPEAVRYLTRIVPMYRLWYEQRLSWTFNDRVHATLFKDPEWHDPQRSINRVNDGHRVFFTDYVISELGERQDLLEHVLPDYPPFAKRMLLDNGWYRALTRDNVKLVPHNLAAISGSTLTSGNGESVEADVLILATGFKAQEVLNSYEIVGREGRVLRDVWQGDNASAYLGTTVAGFPNLFILLGPNVGSGHGGSMIRNIECQTHYALSILEKMFEQQSATAEVREDIYDAYKKQIDEAHEKMVWTHPGVDNWYRNSRGRVVVITPWRNDAFWRMTRQANTDDYVFSGPGASESARQGTA